MFASQDSLMTAEELLAMPDEGRCELIEGRIHQLSPLTEECGFIAANVGAILRRHIRSREMGRTYASGTGFVLTRNPDTVRAPNAAFVGTARLPARHPGYFEGAPDLAVEVVSFDDRVGDIEDKVQQWLDAGTLMVWVVWPATRTITVYRPGDSPLTLRESDDLEGFDVVPGFKCPVAEVFED